VEQGEKKYRQLKQKLDKLLAPPSPKNPVKKPSTTAKKGGWWVK
jgi:hypothetical protein